MSKKRNETNYDQKIIDALKKLPNIIYDKKHNLSIYIENDKCRSNETRFEHIAKKYHELKVRDIESIPEGINDYVKYSKSKELKDTYYYFIDRKGKDKGFIQVSILVDINDKTIAYLKTVYIAYRVK